MEDRTVPFAASYECAVRLAAAGCPLPYLGKLPRRLAKRRRFSVRTVGGYAENVLYDFGGGQLRFVIGLAIRGEMASGVVFTDWLVTVPGIEHVDWDQDAWDVIPARDRAKYDRLMKSRLMAVLDEGGLVARGRPVRGLICGRAFQSIPESFGHDQVIHANVTLTDDAGYTASLRTSLAIDRSFGRRPDRVRKRLAPLFSTPDPPRERWDDWRARPVPPSPRIAHVTPEEFIKSYSKRIATFSTVPSPNSAEKVGARAGDGELEVGKE
jgi:hypothetical protein